MNTPDPFQPDTPFGPTTAEDYRTLVESFTQLRWEANAQGVVVADSPSWRAYTGQSMEQWLDEGWIRAVHPDDRPGTLEQWQEAVAHRRAFNATARLQHPQHGWQWVNLRGTPILNADGSTKKWLVVGIDTSDRQQAEEALQKSQQLEQQLKETKTLQQAVFNTVSHAITVFEAVRNETNQIVDFRFILSNGVADRHMGIPTTGKTLRTVTPGYVDEVNFATMTETVESGQPASKILHFTYGGTNTYLQTRYLKLNDGVVLVHEDITEHKKAEREMLALKDAIAQNATDKYLTLFNNIQQGVAIVEPIVDEAGKPVDYQFLEANPAMAQQSGLTNVIGNTIRRLIPNMAEDVYQTYSNVVATKQTAHFEKKITMPTGVTWFDTYAVSIGPAESNQLAILFTNITERKQNELNTALLDQIGSDLASLSAPAQMTQTVFARMGSFLQASACFFTDLSDHQAPTAGYPGWLDEAAPDPQHAFDPKTYLTDEQTRAAQAGQTVVVDDTTGQQPAPKPDNELTIGSFIFVPHHRQGQWVAGVTLANDTPRHWRIDEIELVEEIANRLLARIDRVRAGDALRISEERLRVLIQNLPDYAIFRLDSGGIITEWTSGAEQVTGYTADEAIGQHLSLFYTPAAIAAGEVEAELNEASQTGRVEREGPRLKKNGDSFFINEIATAIYTETGALTGFTKISRDITARKDAENALRDSQQRLQIILNSVADHAIITLDPQATITSWNPGAERLFGYPSHEAIGLSAAIVFTREDQATRQLEKEMHQARRTGHATDERFHVRKDGTQLYVSGALSPLYDATGQLLGYVKIARDLSDRRRMEQALRDTDRRKDEFLAMLAHELRNPLAPIRNGLQFLALTSEDDQQISALLDIMNRQMDHLVRLVDDLLDVSRISRGRIELRRVPIDLTPVVRQAIDAIRPVYQSNNRQLSVELPDGPLYLTGDATRLHQVVTNLLTNGLRYTSERGQVWVSLAQVGNEAVLRVRDNGIGLTPDQIGVIFDLFVQVDNSLARSNGGLGLGLTLVQQLVDMHGGRVEAYSAGLNKGSEFVVYLPLQHP